MHKLITVLLCLLLCGCAGQSIPDETNPPPENPVLSEAESALEVQYDDLDVQPLSQRKVWDMLPTENGLLLLSGAGNTTLTLISPEDMHVQTELVLGCTLDSLASTLQVGENFVSYYDSLSGETVLLDPQLQELRRITLPEDLCGSPILSSDATRLYYCTSNAIRCWDLETGIRRRVKELSYETQTLTGLHWKDTVLQCSVSDRGTRQTLFLDADTGALLHCFDGAATLMTRYPDYWASLPMGSMQAYLFGNESNPPQALLPKQLSAVCTYLPLQHAAVAVTSTESDVVLEYYDLSTGRRTAEIRLDPLHQPKAIAHTGNRIVLLVYVPEYDCDVLFFWNITDTPVSDAQVYTDHYYTLDVPDHAGLTLCRNYAREIGSKYGIEVLIWKDAAAVQPWDYTFEAEYLYRVIMEQLLTLDEQLSQYPEGVLQQTASHFDSLKFCLVRQITGTAASGSLNTATGIQFFDGADAYVVISAGEYARQALYHELFHVMETHILCYSNALDCWNDLNPAGFSYDYSYSANAQRNSGVYLSGDLRAFVDTYSMSFPKEDRARILEYAMLSDMETLFHSEIMQAKLNALCLGIRQAYNLENSPEVFPWEQYLE